MTAECANGAQCVNGWIECWHPGGLCSEPNDPDCELCGVCLDCHAGGAAMTHVPTNHDEAKDDQMRATATTPVGRISTEVQGLEDARREAVEECERLASVREELLEVIRLTQEYVMLPPLEGWSWWDAYSKHRPNDAERLRREWQKAGYSQTLADGKRQRVPHQGGQEMNTEEVASWDVPGPGGARHFVTLNADGSVDVLTADHDHVHIPSEVVDELLAASTQKVIPASEPNNG